MSSFERGDDRATMFKRHEDTSKVVQGGLMAVSALLSLGSNLPLVGQLCEAAKGCLDSAEEFKSKAKDVTIAARRVCDVLDIVYLMAQNVDCLEEKALVEPKMRRLVELLVEFNKAVRKFGKKGWMKRAWTMRGHVESLTALDKEIVSQLDVFQRTYDLARDKDMIQRTYNIEASINQLVEARVRETGESKGTVVAVLSQDPVAIASVAVDAHVPVDELETELGEFRLEVRAGLSNLDAKMQKMLGGKQGDRKEIAKVLAAVKAAAARDAKLLAAVQDGSSKLDDHAKRSASYHAETTDGINELKAKIDALQMNEAAIQDQYVYDPYDSDDSDQEASLLGWGSFGSTHRMKGREDGRVCAVKLINIKRAGVGVEKLREEAARLSMLDHPNIVNYFTAYRFRKNKVFAIVMELLKGGSLLERLQRVSEPLASDTGKRAVATVKWTTEVASALAHMHTRRMQHRDLKPDNVLFDGVGNAKIIDLGLATVLVAKSKVSPASGANKVGALMYQSPEKAMGRGYDGKDDVWALGCMLGGGVTGRLVEARCPGVFALDPKAVKALVAETSAASAKFGGLVAAMLKHNPTARPTAQDVVRYLGRGAALPTVPGGGTIVEEEEDDEAANWTCPVCKRSNRAQNRECSVCGTRKDYPEEKRQREAAAEAERRRRAAEAKAEAERQRRARAKAAKDEEEKRKRRAKQIDLSKLALVRTLEGHSNTVYGVAVFPDGRRVVSASFDNTLKVWEIATGKCVATLEGHSEAVLGVAVFPDGRRIVSASRDKMLKVWDVATGKCVATLEGHSSNVNCVAVFPDGRRVVSGGGYGDKTLKVWDVATGECVATLEGHSKDVYGVAISPDGRRVLSASWDKTLKVWDLATGECVATLEGHSHWVMSVAISPDGRRVVSGACDKTLKVWDIETGECVATLEGHSKAVCSVAVFPDGRRVVSGSWDETLKVWDVATGECVATLKGHSDGVLGVAVFPDGRRVVSASKDKTLKLYAC